MPLNIGEKYKRLKRYRHIAAVLAKYGFEELNDVIQIKFRKSEKTEEIKKRHSRPVRVRLVLQELGPTFIKLGQFLRYYRRNRKRFRKADR